MNYVLISYYYHIIRIHDKVILNNCSIKKTKQSMLGKCSMKHLKISKLKTLQKWFLKTLL